MEHCVCCGASLGDAELGKQVCDNCKTADKWLTADKRKQLAEACKSYLDSIGVTYSVEMVLMYLQVKGILKTNKAEEVLKECSTQ